MKKVWTAIGVVVVVALAIPLYSTLHGPSHGVKLPAAPADDTVQAAAYAVLSGSCLDCHAEKAEKPFYANWPIASGMVAADLVAAQRQIDLAAALAPADGKPVGEVVLAKLEHVARVGSMPPVRYGVMHWGSAMSDADRQAIVQWVEAVRAANYATPGVPEAQKANVLQPIPQAVELDAAKVALGDKLYHDARLSADESLSCASCHDLAMGGTDQAKSSTGIEGQIGPINSPTVYNAGFQFAQFWDGRAKDLKDQAAGPVNNPKEMGSNWQLVFDKLGTDEALVAEVKAIYPEGLSADSVTDAIATYEHSLITPNSRFDKYLMGDDKAMTDEEKQGYETFVDIGCASCHVGKLLGGQSYESMGIFADYFKARGGELTEADMGRYNVTKNEQDRHKFKVPTLRNLTVTFPYFHDGSTSDIGEAVTTMAKVELGRTLSDAETASIVAFLKTLTGEYNGQLLK